jgi:hypothetical protein
MDKKFNFNLGLDPEKSTISEQIRAIENLNIGPRQKAEAMLVVLNAKPATTISVYEGNDQPGKVREALEDGAGLFTEETKGAQNINSSAEYAIARDQETAKRLSQIDPDRDHEEYGRLMGFPETAIKTFGAPEALDRNDFPNMSGIPFSFSLSKEHWREEFEVLKKWTAMIKEYSPKTFSELVGEDK